MSRFVVGDIHGCFEKFMLALNHSGFDPRKGDILYSAGDFCDRGDNSAAVLQYLLLLHINHSSSLVSCFGNHDLWLFQYLRSVLEGKHMPEDIWGCWDYNGGRSTIKSLKNVRVDDLKLIYEWLGELPYQIEIDDYIIKHSTIREGLLEDKDPNKLTLRQCLEEGLIDPTYDSWWWDRNVISTSEVMFGKNAIPYNTGYIPTEKPLIIGHTPFINGPYWDKDLNIINIDTGSFITTSKYHVERDGEICILNLDTLEWVKSSGEKGVFDV